MCPADLLWPPGEPRLRGVPRPSPGLPFSWLTQLVCHLQGAARPLILQRSGPSPGSGKWDSGPLKPIPPQVCLLLNELGSKGQFISFCPTCLCLASIHITCSMVPKKGFELGMSVGWISLFPTAKRKQIQSQFERALHSQGSWCHPPHLGLKGHLRTASKSGSVLSK